MNQLLGNGKYNLLYETGAYYIDKYIFHNQQYRTKTFYDKNHKYQWRTNNAHYTERINNDVTDKISRLLNQLQQSLVRV